ncbi:23932_t:CDS:2, partial [Racocetra persica]
MIMKILRQDVTNKRSGTIPSINDNVNSSTAFLNITFAKFGSLLTSTGNITIYKASDNSIRQRVSANMHNFCKISVYDDADTISIKVINSTFNEYGERYFVTMDNNFVKRYLDDEPLRGIHDGIWIIETRDLDNRKVYSDNKAVMGSVRLTTEASKNILNFSKHNQSYQSAYFDKLLNELANKVPINRNNEIKRIASE